MADLDAVAARIYNETLDAGEGHHATSVLAFTLEISRATALRRIKRARRRGLIREYTGDHHPHLVRWVTGGSGSWAVCAECRTLWPCTEAATELGLERTP